MRMCPFLEHNHRVAYEFHCLNSQSRLHPRDPSFVSPPLLPLSRPPPLFFWNVGHYVFCKRAIDVLCVEVNQSQPNMTALETE